MAEIVGSQDNAQSQTEFQSAAPIATQRLKRRQELVGTVSSNKMEKTVVVKVDNMVRHPKYKKIIRRTSKFMAHNELDGINIGDKVRIVSTRPLSARKRWRVVEVVQKASR